MRRLWRPVTSLLAHCCAVAALLLLFGCGGNSSIQTRLAAFLRNTQVVPPTSSAATGVAVAILNGTGTTDTSKMEVQVHTSGLTAASVTKVAVHYGTVGQNGPLLFTLFDSGSSAFSGALDVNLTGANLQPDAADGVNTFTDAITAMMDGRTYVEIDTTAFPNGELRGQIANQTYTTTLAGSNEVPPVTSAGAGTSNITVDPALNNLRVGLNTTGLDNSTVTAVEIHVNVAGQTGPVFFTLYNSSTDGPFTGSLSKVLTAGNLIVQPTYGINVLTDALDAIRSGRAYINVITTAHAGGEIRGQYQAVLQ